MISAGAPQCIKSMVLYITAIIIIIIIFFGNFLKYMQVGDQIYIILLEWPYNGLKTSIALNKLSVNISFYLRCR